MERRSEPRQAVDQPVTVCDLATQRQMTATLVELSGRGVRLRLDELLRPGTPVTIQAEDALYLGEIMFSARDNGGCHAGVQVQTCFRDTPSLVNLRRAIAEESCPQVRETV